MNTKRLLKLAAFLDTLPREKFDFGQIAEESGKPMMEALKLGAVRCGTVACAIGWMPAVFPRGLEWKERKNSFFLGSNYPDVVLRNDPSVTDYDAAERWFGLTEKQAQVLFTPDIGGFGLRAISVTASPKTVAKRIRQFVRTQEKRRAA